MLSTTAQGSVPCRMATQHVGCVQRTATGILWCVARTLPILVVLGSVLCGTEASGHALNVYASVQGQTIRGEVYFRGRVPAQDAKVEMFDPAGEKLGQTTTDEQGKFSWEVRFRCDHRLVANAGSGHGAEYTVEAAELPDDLPPRGGLPNAAKPPDPPPAATPASPTPPGAPPGAPPAATADHARLQAMIESAVGKQIDPLRKEISRYQEKIRFADVVGGIGYILGVTGLVFYFLGVRKKGRRTSE